MLEPSQQSSTPPATPVPAALLPRIEPKPALAILVIPLRIEPLVKPSSESYSEPLSPSEPTTPVDDEQYVTLTVRELLLRVQLAQELSEPLSPSNSSSSAPPSPASAPTALTLRELFAKV